MSHPLIERLHTEFGYPLINAQSLVEFTKEHSLSVLFFTGDPTRVKETPDVAVALPEIAKVFPQLTPAVIDRDSEAELQKTYNFLVWPALVFLNNDKFLGCITKIRDWGEYLEEIPKILKQNNEK